MTEQLKMCKKNHQEGNTKSRRQLRLLPHLSTIQQVEERQNFTLRQLGVCEPATRRGLAFCAEMGLPHRGYSLSAGSDADTENEAVMSPEHAMRLWGRGVKSGRSSCLSSRSNSALTLTDTEHENKSDSESGESTFGFVMSAFRASVLVDDGGLFFFLSSSLLSCLLFLPSAFLSVFKAVELEK
ncbi:Teneurin-3 [Myotis brandtii]|uniref:Teneurin-3 n=1 Tax=Myotis brandtii TaxID=109478 RepID=S7NMH0_MYOBR|nr:Teneurin-3 [Myotis brandtii]